MINPNDETRLPQYSAEYWKRIYFEWDTYPNRVDIKDIIVAAEEVGLKRVKMITGYHSAYGGWNRLPPLELLLHYNTKEGDLWFDGHKDKGARWPDEGVRFILTLHDLIRRGEERRRGSPKVAINVFHHKATYTVRGEYLGPRKNWIYSWESYRYDEKWNDVIGSINTASEEFTRVTRAGGTNPDDNIFDI